MIFVEISTLVLGISAIAGAIFIVVGFFIPTKDKTDILFVGIGGTMFVLSGIGFAILASIPQ